MSGGSDVFGVAVEEVVDVVVGVDDEVAVEVVDVLTPLPPVDSI